MISTYFFRGSSLPARSSLIVAFFRHIYYYPTPANLSYFWSFGFLSGMFLALQLITGIILALHYAPLADSAFNLIEHIMRDVDSGWLFRYMHSNGASFFFLVVYIHIGRGLYYRLYSLKNIFIWTFGIIIFFLMMATAFMGYVLPWGQMSFWGATVITNLFSVIPFVGTELVQWIWGGFAVGEPTLTRFFALHFLLPFILVVVVLLHILFVHEVGSSNPAPLFQFANVRGYIPFSFYFFIKDFFLLFIVFSFYFFLIGYYPNLLGHSDNYIIANPLVTPTHIVPEWYFLPFYAILRSVESKQLGVFLMFVSIFIFLFLPIFSTITIRVSHHRSVVSFLARMKHFYYTYIDTSFQEVTPWKDKYSYYFSINPFYSGLVFVFFFIFLLLGWLGSQEATIIYVVAALFFMVAYFLLIFLLGFLFLLIGVHKTRTDIE